MFCLALFKCRFVLSLYPYDTILLFLCGCLCILCFCHFCLFVLSYQSFKLCLRLKSFNTQSYSLYCFGVLRPGVQCVNVMCRYCEALLLGKTCFIPILFAASFSVVVCKKVLNQEPPAKTEVETSKIAPILCFATGLDVVAVLRQRPQVQKSFRATLGHCTAPNLKSSPKFQWFHQGLNQILARLHREVSWNSFACCCQVRSLRTCDDAGRA